MRSAIPGRGTARAGPVNFYYALNRVSSIAHESNGADRLLLLPLDDSVPFAVGRSAPCPPFPSGAFRGDDDALQGVQPECHQTPSEFPNGYGESPCSRSLNCTRSCAPLHCFQGTAASSSDCRLAAMPRSSSPRRDHRSLCSLPAIERFPACQPDKGGQLRVENGPNGHAQVVLANLVLNPRETVLMLEGPGQSRVVDRTVHLAQSNTLLVWMIGPLCAALTVSANGMCTIVLRSSPPTATSTRRTRRSGTSTLRSSSITGRNSPEPASAALSRPGEGLKASRPPGTRTDHPA